MIVNQLISLPSIQIGALRDRIEYKYLVGVAFLLALFMDIMDSTVVNVALPRLGQQFGATTSMLEWVVSGYLLSLAVCIPASGWLGDRFGTKRIFLLSLGIFLAGSTLCGAAWSVESLAVFRVLQGIGGVMMVPVGSAMLFRAFTGQTAQTEPVLSPWLRPWHRWLDLWWAGHWSITQTGAGSSSSTCPWACLACCSGGWRSRSTANHIRVPLTPLDLCCLVGH